ncbi:hypothetical protein [Nocardioides sp. cx-173]|uniref:hypothetical protein n=1 Tax=Nocardioides sp. cx-173 TaxID=2898796 RepID=UPI001E2DC5E6|nr:hypothetical protein [Nocardioides sp. cx-173]MCD4526863.1 hypothetical protein [Nocardioides sp. cx-173]UGB41348.1 hypothetical protein LQ940_18505 [Nocardioides sp. cx-173]
MSLSSRTLQGARLTVAALFSSTALVMAAPLAAQADPGESITYWCDEPRSWTLKDTKLKTTWQKFNGCPYGEIMIESSSRGWLWMYGGSCADWYYEEGGRSLLKVRDVCDAIRV